MRQEGMEKFPIKETKTDKAVKKLKQAFDESVGLSAEEIEDEILSIEGVKEGGGLKEMREKSEKKKNKQETIH